MVQNVRFCEPTLEGNEVKYVEDAIKTGWLSNQGPYVKKFEEAFAKYCGVKHGVAMTSGTAAIHMALEALNIGKGDEVIVSNYTMIATANAIIYAGAKPVLVDSRLDDWNIDPNQIEAKITDKTKAILVVHLFGHPCAMDEINAIAKKHNLKVIEDAAEAHGAEYKGKKAGSLGDVGAFSFFGNKILTTGEGGMLVCDEEEVAKTAFDGINHFFGEPRYQHKRLGYCYRMTNLQAAVGLAQTEQAEKLSQMRIDNAMKYNALLKEIPGIVLPPQLSDVRHVYWMYPILIDEEKFGINAESVRKKLDERKVGNRAMFYGMHKQPYFNDLDPRYPDTTGAFPVSDQLQQQGILLPSTSHLTTEQIEFVAKQLEEIYHETH